MNNEADFYKVAQSFEEMVPHIVSKLTRVKGSPPSTSSGGGVATGNDNSKDVDSHGRKNIPTAQANVLRSVLTDSGVSQGKVNALLRQMADEKTSGMTNLGTNCLRIVKIIFPWNIITYASYIDCSFYRHVYFSTTMSHVSNKDMEAPTSQRDIYSKINTQTNIRRSQTVLPNETIVHCVSSPFPCSKILPT